MSKITIDENGQILIPLEMSKRLGLQNQEWLKVNVKSEQTVLTNPGEIDSALLEDLIHQGIIF